MLRDVFYFGTKPNVHPKEQPAKNLVDARKKATTEHFWIINEFCDYTNFDWDFDFEFLPDSDVWAEDHNNVWPSLYQKDSGTWLCANNKSDVIVYRCDVDPLKRKNIVTDNWKLLENIDIDKWDFSWHPDPTDPPFIYKWGSKYAPAELSTCLEYHVPGATDIKYMNTIVELLPNWDSIVEVQKVDRLRWDMSWRPDPMDPPYIYVWGNKYVDGKLRATLEYHVPGATEKKYMNELVPVLPEWDRWDIIHDVDKTTFDFSWRPDPREPDFIYVFGNEQYEAGVMPTIEYHMPDATERKYLHDMKAKLSAHAEKFEHLEKADSIDYSWVPDPTAPPYIYAWGNQWNKPEDKVSIQYVVEGATEYKFMEARSKRKPCMDNWEVPANVDTTGFDFSWEPSPADPAYIYEFGTQWQKTGGPRYVVEGATEVKYIEFQKVKALSTTDRWTIPTNCDVTGFDFSWHPDSTSPPYTYHFATQWALTGGPIYNMEGATEIKYVEHPSAIALPSKDNWEIPSYIDSDAFDFSWHPYAQDEPYIYQFGTQHQKTGGPVYKTPGIHKNSAIKYIDTRVIQAKRLPNKKNFAILNNYKIKDFDWSWHPDDTDEPYIYVFGNNLYPAEIMPTIEYSMPGAKQIKYVNNVIATLDVDMTNWEVPDDIDCDGFDFSWKPNPKEPAFIYEFGTQWQKTGGPRYIVQDAFEVKYVDSQKVKALVSDSNWTIPVNCDVAGFDFSWHPDRTSPPYIYHFATQWALTGGPIYTCPDAVETKYLDEPSAIALPNKDNWEIPSYIDSDAFDFSWHPYVEDQPYIYQFGTQHQKTGGPRYLTPGSLPSSPVKYIDTRIIRSIRKPSKKNFAILNNYKIKDFDWSWHPDDTDEPYIYVFGNNQHPAEIMPTIEYVVPGATQIKYVSDVIAVLDVDMTNWEVPDNTDTSTFDFSWRPNPKDPAFIYQFGTQHQKTGGPRYVVPDADEVKYVSTHQVTALPTKDNWTVPSYVDTTDFDFSWHPDDTSPPYIYHFATQWALTGGPVYTVPGASETKYLEEPSAIALENKDNWEVPAEIDADSFDFSWHPYVEDQPYVYQFGTQHQKTGGPKYITPGVIPSSPIKYIDTRILKSVRKTSKKNFAILNNYKIKEFDFSWHPDDTDEPYIYVFGNTQHPAEIMPTIEYVVPGAKQIKYVTDIIAILDVDMTNWEVPDDIDITDFDFSWKPNPKDPAFIYQFGTQWQKTSGPRYVVPGADEVKYVSTQKVKALPNQSNWTIPTHIDVTGFDFSWHPDDTSPAYIYHFATQWALTGGPIYTVPGAVETKYLEEPSAIALENKDNWEVPEHIDVSDFDFSWHPYVEDQPYVYQFGTQWQKTGGPKYVTPGVIPSSPVKYIDTRILKSKRLPNKKNFAILNNYKIKEFDWSWHPDETDEPYIYVFGNTQHPAEIMPTVEYKVPGAKQIKYVSDVIAVLDVDMTNWEVPASVDTTGFDFSWKPNPKDPAFIYEFSTQWQKTGGPRYVVPDATEVKYVTTQKVKALPDHDKWTLPENIDVTDFDFSWHPDSTSPPYNYHFATQWALSGGPVYKMDGAIATKYMDSPSAKALPNKTNWEVPVDIDESDFDFSWHPYAEDDPYIYQFGTQWQKTGGPRYVTPGAKRSAPVKYIDTRIITSKKLPTKSKFTVLNNLVVASFDWSWHPDDTDGEFIYVFGNTQYPAEVMPTIEYRSSPYAEKTKYVNDIKAVLATDIKDWDIPSNIDVSEFDFSWKPNPNDPPFIYQFGTQWQKTGGPRYIVESATEIKYVEGSKAKSVASKKQWIVPTTIDSTNFDYSWHPDETEELYVYEFGTQWQKTGGPRYITTGSTSDTPVKYCDDVKARHLPNKKNFNVLVEHEIKDFDYSWHPDDTDKPYIYVFGNKQYSAEVMPTIEYKVPGAIQVKYVHDIVATLNNNKKNWDIPKDISTESFDFSWLPHPNDPPYIYQFGTQHQKTGGPRYITHGSTSDTPVKYCDDIKARRLPNKKNFNCLVDHDIKDFDYSWHPDDTDKPYIYVFGNKQYSAEVMPTLEYKVPGSVQVKYVHDVVATLNNNKKNWDIPNDIITEKFDFSWLPHPKDPPYIYQFGTQHQKTGGPRYVTPTATDIKYVTDLTAKRKQVMNNWIIPEGVDVSNFDFSWHPDELAPPYIYQFGTVTDDKDGPKYVPSINNGEVVFKQRINKPIEDETIEDETVEEVFIGQYYIETTLEDLVNKHPDEIFWALNSSIDYTNFDFTWRPEIIHIAWESAYVNVFGSPDSPLTQTYFVNAKSYLAGNKDFKFVENVKLSEEYLSTLFVKPDMFFVDRGNSEASARFEMLKAKFGNIQKTRYLNSWVDTINRCINRSTTELCWILNSELDYSDFDFNYYPNPWQMKMVHVFGTQWSHWGTTFMVNREAFPTDTKYIKIIEHLSNLNFVKSRTAKSTNVLHDIYYIDHGNTANIPGTTVIPYDTDYLTTFKNIISKLPEKKEHYIWIASTVCDYTGFDFTYICDPFAREQLHVFPSDKQKFGDTFLVNVNKLRELINDMESLKDYDKINFNQHQRTKRLEAPVIVSDFDSHVATVMQDFDFPYATFVTSDNKDITVVEEEPMNLWDIESKNILITSTGGTRIIVPKEAKQYVETQLYDYPYIKTASRLAKSSPLDIVFLSNGEACADENYEHLLKATKGLPNRIVRVDGVNGRVEAYHAAAEASNTPWMFTVFAKLKINTKFDFNWQPDRLQIPKHYMFLAKNPVNGLIYGHQGMIAYNKQMTLDNPGYGLDFTLDSPHETIELLSGIATYNTDEWSTWRTAFREVIKLKKEDSEISNSRLEAWLTKATGDFAQSSLDGAKDGIDYYNEVDGKTDKLKLSYEWAWLRERFSK